MPLSMAICSSHKLLFALIPQLKKHEDETSKSDRHDCSAEIQPAIILCNQTAQSCRPHPQSNSDNRMTEQLINVGPLIKDANDGLTAEEQTGLKQQLAEKIHQLSSLADADHLSRARLQLDIAEILNALERRKEAWEIAREAFAISMQQESWQDAVEACNVLYQAEQPDSIAVLGMGLWLAVTFPVDPELTVAMLVHAIDEMPDDADGAALAAITARYVVDLRAGDDKYESQSFFVNNLLAMVAKRHGNVQNQDAMDKWLDRLELRDPQVFLPRLAQVVDAIVGDKWWFDRDVLRGRLPE
jgi:hypothetical protein